MDKHHYSGEREINLLTELIHAHKDILLDKRTDHNMIAKKSETWKKVTSHFNAAGLCPPKTCQQVKRLWEHQKSK
ncbi:hypothetical protein E2C01_074819 [Portunus trituberculatus]|uniref:Regulatory protein zeste n=1 Tax=Portunus trituberculatus TaxID=210409 RepID=A0A5B7IDE5_PORTR|nr:hypothetical protein [Portunus trituberculatus]